jgi:L-rhamnose mutarotase
MKNCRCAKACIWPYGSKVQAIITECNIQNYSIYMHDLDGSGHFLFSYFEYIRTDYDADMAKMAADPTTQEWWSLCEPCQ